MARQGHSRLHTTRHLQYLYQSKYIERRYFHNRTKCGLPKASPRAFPHLQKRRKGTNTSPKKPPSFLFFLPLCSSMSDRDSPAASPARRPRAESDSRSPAPSPKSSPQATTSASATAAREDSDEAPADAADAADGRRATSRSPSPRGDRREAAREERGNGGTNLNPGNNLYIANLPHSVRLVFSFRERLARTYSS